MKKIVFVLTSFFIIASCRNAPISRLMEEVVVDTDQTVTLPLSLITEEIEVIELELTDESITGPERIKQVLFSTNQIIIVESNNILVFDKNGKFIRSIASRGQGPGDYNYIKKVAIDEKNQNLYILNADSKILCYNLNGQYVRNNIQIKQDGFSICDLSYIDDLLLVAEQWRKNEKGAYKHSAVLRLNNDLLITDSIRIRDDYFELESRLLHSYENYLFCNNSNFYVYFPDLYSIDAKPTETVLRDTLYRFEKNLLIPELKLNFKNNGIDSDGSIYFYLYNIYRSSRYVFAVYTKRQDEKTFRYCFDMETKKGYNVLNDEFMDDINQIEEPVKIRPLTMKTDYFYYLSTRMKPEDFEEPNPTLFIGKLKQLN